MKKTMIIAICLIAVVMCMQSCIVPPTINHDGYLTTGKAYIYTGVKGTSFIGKKNVVINPKDYVTVQRFTASGSTISFCFIASWGDASYETLLKEGMLKANLKPGDFDDVLIDSIESEITTVLFVQTITVTLNASAIKYK